MMHECMHVLINSIPNSPFHPLLTTFRVSRVIPLYYLLYQGSGGALPGTRYTTLGGSVDLQVALQNSYAAAMTAGTYGTTYATVSFQEYFAEGVQDFFDVNVMGKRFVPI